MKKALWIALFLAWMAGGPTAAVAQSPLGDRLRSPQPGDRHDDKKAKDSPRVEGSGGGDKGPAGAVEKPAPTDNEAYRLGVDAVNNGKWDDAITSLTEAIQLDPKSALAYSTRGLAYTMKENFEAALTDLDTALRLSPNNATAHFNRAFAYYRKGDKDKAIEDYSETIRIDPKYANAYRDRGFIKTLRGKYGDGWRI